MLTQEITKERLIQPFKSRVSKKPATPGSRVIEGGWSKRLDDMGFKDWAGDAESEEHREVFENRVRWDVAHRNYSMLKPCISIEAEYDEAVQQLAYTIDLYGDGSVVKNGHLPVSRGDYLMFYMRMDQPRRKESLISRIALANVGMLVPYVKFDDLSCNDLRTHVHAAYRIVL
jgi:hypothetical protein